jgi:RNA methyltransferase, rsmE family
VLRAAGNRPLTILVGPEGDFSAGEIALALENGFLPVSLGEARLRTETAALVSVALAGT